MPLGFERINVRKQPPNPLINFIKPLEGPDQPLALDFLERVAAICYPVMKANHIAVMSLEEYEANLEFVGRNFNAGEVIQLVLKAPHTGEWLPFRHVQMVMMHELAHCKQMNHSGAFWKVRNQYAGELRALWDKQYTGEGLWSRGRTLLSGQYTTDTVPDAAFQPRSLCGGTYRSGTGRKRKRKAARDKPKLTYAERQQRRILKKFGAGGTTLGDDEDTRARLEGAKGPKAKPRVAGSARGRELRAAAALARFDKAKEDALKQEEGDGTDSDTEDDSTEAEEPALDLDGKRMVDSTGRGMVKVCEGEDGGSEELRRELEELRIVDEAAYGHNSQSDATGTIKIKTERAKLEANGLNQIGSLAPSTKPKPPESSTDNPTLHPESGSLRDSTLAAERSTNGINLLPEADTSYSAASLACPTCSLINDGDAITCAACGNVLKVGKLSSHWRCKSLSCQGGSYINPGDSAVCGACGASKALSTDR